eukprot:5816418-Amphidinium_carterae.1
MQGFSVRHEGTRGSNEQGFACSTSNHYAEHSFSFGTRARHALEREVCQQDLTELPPPRVMKLICNVSEQNWLR